MVRLGTVNPKVWNTLEKQGLSQETLDEDIAAQPSPAVGAKVTPKPEKIAEEVLKEMKTSKDFDWRSTADAAKEAREFYEKYGMFNGLMRQEWVIKLMDYLEGLKKIKLLGKPRMPTPAIIILLFMFIRANQPLLTTAMVAAFLYNVHPVVIVSVAVGLKLWGWTRKPKGFIKKPAKVVEVDDKTLGVEEYVKGQTEVPQEVDHIIIGSDISGLYVAALLSRLGHTCVVLESEQSVGKCVLKRGDVEYQYGQIAVGHAQALSELLRVVTAENSPRVQWEPVGTEDDGYAYALATVEGISSEEGEAAGVSDVIFRAGKDALVEDQMLLHPEAERASLQSFINSVEGLAKDQQGFMLSKVFSTKSAKTFSSFVGGNYSRIAGQPAQAVLSRLPNSDQWDLLRCQFRNESLPLTELSFGAFVSALNHHMQGLSVPLGGFSSFVRALVPTILSAGGRVITKAVAKSIDVEEKAGPAGKSSATATGVTLESGETIKCRRSVISAEGVMPTFVSLLPPSVGIPEQFEFLNEARPHLYVVVLLKGSKEELELPTSDYFYIPAPDSGSRWMRISFPSAKDPAWPLPDKSTCIIEVEAEDDLVEQVIHKAGSNGSLRCYRMKADSNNTKARRHQTNLLAKLQEIFPQLQDKIEENGVLGPLRAGLSHTPARFAVTSLRPQTHINKLFLTGRDLSMGTFAGAVISGWLTAHSITGYSPLEMIVFGRNMIADLDNVQKR